MTQRPDQIRMRVAFLGMVFLSLMSALALRLWTLQVLTHEQYEQAAEQNKVRFIPIEPARGQILDRNGEVLVRNRTSNVVSARPHQLHDKAKTIANLSQLLAVSPEEIQARLADKRVLPYSAVPLAEDVPEDINVYIKEHQDQFPGIESQLRPVRIYPQGTLATHLLGYVGEINAEQLDQQKYKDRGYRPGSIAGRSGIEDAYEHDLRGSEGLIKLVVDSRGKVRKTLGRPREAEPGNDLVTTIDAKVQALVEESLAAGIQNARTVFDKESGKRYLAPAGGALVMDPRNGEVIAMASYPSYDPAAFVGGISRAEFDALNTDPATPLFNRVTQAQFPPGSTFKTVTTAAALEEGIAQRNGRYACPASYRYADRTFRNWKTTDSGMISVPQAILDSCDTVFYQWGAEFYRRFRANEGEILQDYARAFGFGSRTGFEVGGDFEKSGRVPDEAWLKTMNRRLPKAFPYSIWLPGYTVNLTIGQGDILATPLQVANSYAAIANGGTLYEPHVGLRVMDGDAVVRTVEPKSIRSLSDKISVANMETIRRGLEQVATDGTAAGAFAGFPFGRVSIASKTGTAELQQIPPKQPLAWFAAYAPAKDPRYVVVVMLEEGGHGGETAAPVARRIIEGLFGLPLSNIAPAARTD